MNHAQYSTSKRMRRWLFLPPVCIGLGVVVWLATAKKDLPRVDNPPRAVHVNVLQMQKNETYPEATGYGTAQAFRTWTAMAEVGGRIEKTHPYLRDGTQVQANELLFEIDPQDYQIRREQREAELLQAKSKLDQIRLQSQADAESLIIQKQLLAVRKNEVSRIEQLRGGIASSAAELDSSKIAWLQQAQSVQNLEGSLATYDAQLASAEASVRSAESGLRSAERDVERTRISVPFNGTLAGVSLEEAQYVAPNQQLFQVIDTSRVEIEAQFSLVQLRMLFAERRESTSRENLPLQRSENFVSSPIRTANQQGEQLGMENWIRGLSADVLVRSGNVETPFPATVERMTGTVDEQTRTLGIVVRVDNRSTTSPFSLAPGTYCEVRLRTSQPTLVYILPRNSLESGTVLVVDQSNQLQRRAVQVAFGKQETAAVTSGLSDGDLVVVNPSASLRAGVLVEPHKLHTHEPNDYGGSGETTCPKSTLGSSDTERKTHD